MKTLSRPDAGGDRTMCFSDPAKVFSIDGSTARLMTADGLVDASLRLMEASGEFPEVGDWVLVSLGLVVAVIDDERAHVLFNDKSTLRNGTGP